MTDHEGPVLQRPGEIKIEPPKDDRDEKDDLEKDGLRIKKSFHKKWPRIGFKANPGLR